MISSTNYSDVNVRPRRYRGIRSSKKSILYSDYNADEDAKNGNLGQRSVSLTALPHNSCSVVPSSTTVPSGGPLLEPRMAQLETLEAKMASIEVSLSTTQRRKNGKKNGNALIPNLTKTSTFRETSPVNIFPATRPNTLIDTCRELEVLRNALKDKENTIQNLQGQMSCSGKMAYLQPLDPSERRSAEMRLQNLKQEEETRKSSIKKINLTLEQIDTKEANIDVRIKQAELEYELGREELGLLGVREEMRSLMARLDAKPTPTLYSVANVPGKYTLHCVNFEYDPKSPRFGAGNVEDKNGLFVLWAADNSGLHKGDRILEVNGKLTLATTKEEMIRLLTVCPSRAEMVVCRAWVAPPSTEDFLRRENLRLTHRISYLEDQVSELLLVKENSLASEKEPSRANNSNEGFRSDRTEFLNPSLITDKADGGNVKQEAFLLCNSRENNGDHPKGNIFGNSAPVTTISVNCYDVPLGSPQRYQEIDSSRATPIKLQKLGEKIKTLSKKCERDEFFSSAMKITRNKAFLASEGTKTNFGLISNLKSGFGEENAYSLSDLEKSTRKPTDHYCRSVDYSSETGCLKYSTQQKDRKAKSVDDVKPMPPKKPIRLSVSKAINIQNGESDISNSNTIRKIKRSVKGEAPQPPIFYEKKVNEDVQYIVCDSAGSRTSSRADSRKTQTDSGQINFRWVRNSTHNKSRTSEKWC